MKATLKTVQGGWRCRHHRKGLTVVGAEAVDTPPSAKFRSKRDAERFTEWVMAQGAYMRMDGNRIKALLTAVATWNKLQERAEKEMLDELKRVLEQNRAAWRLMVKAREEYEDSHDTKASALEEQLTDLRDEVKAGLDKISGMQAEQQRRYHGTRDE